MSFSVEWDETSPSGSQDISLGDDRIREFKTQIRERIQVDHRMPSTDTALTGFHEKVTLLSQTTDPAQLSNALVLYTKTAGGARELFTRHESANLQQITLNGKLWLSALGITGQVKGDIPYFDGTIWNRFIMGSSLQQIRVNAAGTDLEYFTPASTFTSGMIMMWSGAIAAIPSGWVFCNGSNGTPDLRDRFVICAKQDSSAVAKSNVEGSLNASGGSLAQPPGFTYANGPTSGPSGPQSPYSGNFQAVIPPYYALAYIMKT